MSTEQSKIELKKLTEQVSIVLSKKGVAPTVMVQVGFATDVSGSIEGSYLDGTMQNIVNRLQALSNRFDDNQTLDMWAFHNGVIELEPAVPSMFGSYVKDYILSRSDLWGGTSFVPVLEMVRDHYFGGITEKPVTGHIPPATGFFKSIFSSREEPKPTITESVVKGNGVKLPVYLIFLTDGDNDDTKATDQLISDLQTENIYIQMVGVGRGSTFRFIKGLAAKYDHVGFVDFSDPSKVTDEQMYAALLNDEFVNWLKK